MKRLSLTFCLTFIFGLFQVLALSIGCSAGGDSAGSDDDDNDNDDDNDDNDSADDDDDNSSDGDADSDSDGDADGDTDDDCSEDSKYVYVVDGDPNSSSNSLYRFDPPNKTITLIGPLNCEAGSATPFSMAVSREDVAYVLFVNSFSECAGIFAVSTSDANCFEKTGFQCGTNNFNTFGMGFSTNGPDTTEETLYVGQTGGLTGDGLLGILDTGNWSVQSVGTIPGGPEFTGNGNGELWGFFPQETPPLVAQINKDSGLPTVQWPLDGLSSDANAWAFAHWGGSYYIFYKTQTDASTNIYKVTDGVMELYMENTGRFIVGAGVSTCAPVVPPV